MSAPHRSGPRGLLSPKGSNADGRGRGGRREGPEGPSFAATAATRPPVTPHGTSCPAGEALLGVRPFRT